VDVGVGGAGDGDGAVDRPRAGSGLAGSRLMVGGGVVLDIVVVELGRLPLLMLLVVVVVVVVVVRVIASAKPNC
jgi:hypothetical protein